MTSTRQYSRARRLFMAAWWVCRRIHKLDKRLAVTGPPGTPIFTREPMLPAEYVEASFELDEIHQIIQFIPVAMGAKAMACYAARQRAEENAKHAGRRRVSKIGSVVMSFVVGPAGRLP